MAAEWPKGEQISKRVTRVGAGLLSMIVTVTTVSHHMKQLVDAGLVPREQRGKWAFYRVVGEALAAVVQSLAAVMAHGYVTDLGQPERDAVAKDRHRTHSSLMHHEPVTSLQVGAPAWQARRKPPAPTNSNSALDQATLRLLADPLRARIVELLSTEALCTSHLVEMTGAKQTNVSNHLRALRDAGLVTTEPCGRFTYNVLVPDSLSRLSSQLADLAAAASRPLPRRACP